MNRRVLDASAVLASSREFLVCHDYGTGGLWWWIEAESADAINAMFKGVEVFHEPPDWWNEDKVPGVEHRRLSDPPEGALALLLRI